MLMNFDGKEGFVCKAELPSSANIHMPTLNFWQPPPPPKETKSQDEEMKFAEPTFPVIVQVYVGALTFLGLYFIYRCTKR